MVLPLRHPAIPLLISVLRDRCAMVRPPMSMWFAVCWGLDGSAEIGPEPGVSPMSMGFAVELLSAPDRIRTCDLRFRRPPGALLSRSWPYGTRLLSGIPQLRLADRYPVLLPQCCPRT
jgi:hypothetical protein